MMMLMMMMGKNRAAKASIYSQNLKPLQMRASRPVGNHEHQVPLNRLQDIRRRLQSGLLVCNCHTE